MSVDNSRQRVLNVADLLRVSVGQFYGIEYEDFPCQIAQVGMWLVDHQMNRELGEMFGQVFTRLPLVQTATIVHGNALTTDWAGIVAKEDLSYILGNPPFVGKKEQSKAQKEELIAVFDNQKGIGNLDYVTAWYRKAADTIGEAPIRAAFVSTNSIAQGEQPAAFWRGMPSSIKIDFAYRTFKWANEAKGKAAVHCVIIGFSPDTVATTKVIYDGDEKQSAQHINAYLVDAPDVLIESRSLPVSDVPKMSYGSMPIDDGALILSENEHRELSTKEPDSIRFVRRYVGGEELINSTRRYCLWLKDVPPNEYRALKLVMDRVARCKAFRSASSRPQTLALADAPQVFGEIRQPDTSMLVVPKVSSESRKYIPVDFVSQEIIVNGSALIVPEATNYHFGILSSNVHNAWMRAVAGRMKSDYQYSNKIVYNNFPWPQATPDQKTAIETAAQGVLDARARFPDSSLADLYDPLTMPPELVKAHDKLDRAVMQAYGYAAKDFTEAKCVADLMRRYREMVA